ncbi:hypothetical protein CRG98_006511 [Punica granatum]|nr:hypothetical protein CRG98_006511 [Punica granatum]
MGHLIPFLRLSESLARRGHRVSFLSTPRNLQRLHETRPRALNIDFVPLPFPPVLDLPTGSESAMDVPYPKQQLLKIALDSLEPQVRAFLEGPARPDWIIFDYASHWLPAAATGAGVASAYLGLFTAATLSFIGPPEARMDGPRSTIEDFTTVPSWVPPKFESNVAYRLHEIAKYMDRSEEYTSVTSDTERFGISIRGCNMVAVRTCIEFEPEWFGLLSELYRKPVVPIGLLPPTREEYEGAGSQEKWLPIKHWLDEQRPGSVVYVALGTESSPSQEELTELALGLDQSDLPFFWVLRDAPESTQSRLENLPDGFLERVRGRGVICTEWAPQSRILSHDAVGGFLTHCGCNSFIEALMFSRVLVMLPMLNDQGLNARLLSRKGVGVEVPRDEKDGSFTHESVAESLRLAIVDESGETLRAKARQMKSLFGDMERNEIHVDGFVRYLEENRK